MNESLCASPKLLVSRCKIPLSIRFTEQTNSKLQTMCPQKTPTNSYVSMCLCGNIVLVPNSELSHQLNIKQAIRQLIRHRILPVVHIFYPEI